MFYCTLTEAGMMSEDDFVKPVEPSTKDLLVVHTKEYLKSLQVSKFFIFWACRSVKIQSKRSKLLN